MSENLIIPYDSISNFFLNKAEESFQKEKKIYNNFPDLKITSYIDLNGNKCKKLFEKINGIEDDEVLYMLRDKNFYRMIEQNFSIKQDTDLGKIQDFDVKNISENIRSKLKDKKNFEINFEVIINSIDSRYTTRGYKILKEKIEKGITDDIKDNINKELKTMNIKTEKGNLSWTQDHTKEALLLIEKEIGEDIFSKEEYFIVDPKIEKLNLTNVFKQSMEKAILIYQDYIKEEYKDSNKGHHSSLSLLKSLRNGKYDKLIEKGFKKDNGEDLVFSSKGSNYFKVRGDLAEFICGLILNNIGETHFAGDIKTSSGEAAIDIYANEIGYQIKNYSTFESQPIISLYQQKLFITNEKTNGRVFTENEYFRLYTDVNLYKEIKEEYFKNDIFSILQNAFPNFIRYSQNFYENDKVLIEQGFNKIKNCFYILNFRIIPASRIFYELYLQSLKQEKNEQLNNYFYIKETSEEEINPLENLINSINNFKPWKSFYLYFKGIQINQKGLRLNSSGTNLLSGNFKKSSYRI